MLLIGGHALRYHVGDLVKRQSLDTDFIATYDEFKKWSKEGKWNYLMPANEGKKMIAKNALSIFEIEIAWPGSTAASLLKLLNVSEGPLFTIADLNTLYTLKMSHRFLKNSPHFLKTMSDIHLMRNAGARIPDYLRDWYTVRQKETYNYKHPNLNQNKNGFFDKNQGVKYVYDHDSIHLAMAQLDKPAYQFYKSDKAEVFCDRAKFEALPQLTKLYGVLEEAYVLALERSQIPFTGQVTPLRSFEMALQKVCTSITSGWFREFAWENYYKVLALYNENYVTKFWDAVEKGIVIKLKAENV